MSGAPFRRVLVANRGEIAVRIIRACHELGIEAVAIYSEADADAGHVRMADTALPIGPSAPTESYLRIDAVVQAALESGAEAVHPGYGFLAERAEFARAVEDAGLDLRRSVVGCDRGTRRQAPRAAARGHRRRALGARHARAGAGRPAGSDRRHRRNGRAHRLPAAGEGRGGWGRTRDAPGRAGRTSCRPRCVAGSREAASAFGDGSVYLEREILPARHVEVQLLADAHGHVVALGERDCSLQRRHQKLVEEAPAPGLTEADRRRLHALAVRLGEAAGLRNAATCEFLLDTDGAFWFLEVNTRLQVEHGVTELVAGVDIVAEQLRIAAGEPLSAAVLDAAGRAATPGSHAIEVRIAAEDPSRAFAPTPGEVGRWIMPAGPGVRVDTAIESGDRVPPEYDNLIAKLMVHATDRPAAIDRLRRALDETEIGGVQTTLPFHRAVARSVAFRDAVLSTGWVEEHWDGETARRTAAHRALLAAAIAAMSEAPAGPSAGPAAVVGGWDAFRGIGGSRASMACRVADGGGGPMADVTARRPAATSGAAVPASGGAAPTSGGDDGERPVAPDPRAIRARLAPASSLGNESPISLAPAAEPLRMGNPSVGTGPLGGTAIDVGRRLDPVLAQRQLVLDGQPADLELSGDGAGRYRLRQDGAVHRLTLGPVRPVEGGRRRREVLVDGFRFEVDVESERIASLRERAERGRAASAHSGPLEVRAIIPGAWSRSRSRRATPSRAGEQLLVVEAMKMQNELRAPRDGTVERLVVARRHHRGWRPAGRHQLTGGRNGGRGRVGRKGEPPAARTPGDAERPRSSAGGRRPGPGPSMRPRSGRSGSPRRPGIDPGRVHAGGSDGQRPGRRSRSSGRVPVHPWRPADDVPIALLDDAPVRGLRHRGRDQRALPIPARAGPDRALGRLRPADPDGLRLGRAGGGRARWGGSASRSPAWPTWRPCSTGIPLGEVSTSMTINATAPMLLALYVAAAERQGVARSAVSGHDAERHPQGVHRPGDLDLSAPGVDAPGHRHLRVRRPRAAALEHDQHLRLPHARGRRDGRPGARVHAGRRDRLRRGGHRPRSRGGRLRAPAVVLLRGLVGAVRGGGQVPGRSSDVGADHARSVRGAQRQDR